MWGLGVVGESKDAGQTEEEEATEDVGSSLDVFLAHWGKEIEERGGAPVGEGECGSGGVREWE